MPERERRYLHLVDADLISLVEIAVLLNIPLGTVRSRMRPGLEKMRGPLLPDGSLTNSTAVGSL